MPPKKNVRAEKRPEHENIIVYTIQIDIYKDKKKTYFAKLFLKSYKIPFFLCYTFFCMVHKNRYIVGTSMAKDKVYLWESIQIHFNTEEIKLDIGKMIKIVRFIYYICWVFFAIGLFGYMTWLSQILYYTGNKMPSSRNII